MRCSPLGAPQGGRLSTGKEVESWVAVVAVVVVVPGWSCHSLVAVQVYQGTSGSIMQPQPQQTSHSSSTFTTQPLAAQRLQEAACV